MMGNSLFQMEHDKLLTYFNLWKIIILGNAANLFEWHWDNWTNLNFNLDNQNEVLINCCQNVRKILQIWFCISLWFILTQIYVKYINELKNSLWHGTLKNVSCLIYTGDPNTGHFNTWNIWIPDSFFQSVWKFKNFSVLFRYHSNSGL